MKYLPNLLLVIGVCAGALGASGFQTPYDADAVTGTAPTREPYALGLFLLGCASLTAGGVLTRQARRSGSASGENQKDELAFYTDGLDAIRAIVVELDEDQALSPAEVHARIDRLMSEQFFDLTSRSDELVQRIGFSDYARVWEGVAVAERLLNRCWSMITDGYPEEGRAELPLARKSIEQAAEALASL